MTVSRTRRPNYRKENPAMSTMRVAQVPAPGAPFEIVERPIPEPGPGEVRIKVEACGVCHSDMFPKLGLFPGIPYPIVPGHEVVGVVDAVGSGVTHLRPGRRVGAGWNGGYCSHCDPCRGGDFFACEKEAHTITGVTRDGGYAEYMVANASAVARMPEGLDFLDAAPLLCAGLTPFNALRHCGAIPGDTVAILGIGGLGHLGVQYAKRMGFRTIAVARGKDKEALAMALGADHYIDSEAGDPAQALIALGKARAIIATVTHGPAMSALMPGMAPRGTLMVLGAAEKLEVSPGLMIGGSYTVRGWYSGTSIDAQDTLAFRSTRWSGPTRPTSEC
jgi:D-arabinose 1-dehydrogenase-like Zn-dependent alcohol dehydrogenase